MSQKTYILLGNNILLLLLLPFMLIIVIMQVLTEIAGETWSRWLQHPKARLHLPGLLPQHRKMKQQTLKQRTCKPV